jgi:CHAT domain-containing protein
MLIRLLSLRALRICTFIAFCGFLYRADSEDLSRVKIQFLLRGLSGTQQLAGGRLSGMPYPGARTEPIARLHGILFTPDDRSVPHRRISAFVYVLGGKLDKAEKQLRELALELPHDAAIQNDLGVIAMALAASNPNEWPLALRQFESALASWPNFPEAKFNLILTYRRLGLRTLEAAALAEYSNIEADSAWRIGIRDMGKPEDENSQPASARQLVMDFVFRPAIPIPANYERIAQALSDQYGDDTPKFALNAILSNNFDDIAHVRNLLETGRKLYQEGRIAESRQAFKAAKDIAGKTNSLFDQLWAEIGEADIMVKFHDFSHAAEVYQHVAEVSRHHRLQWLLARSLSSLGSWPQLAGGTVEAMSRLYKAVEVYRTIGEGAESARPLYYLAADHFLAASFEDSLKFGLESLRLARPDDHLRLTELNWLISETLSRMGYSDIASRFNEEAANHAEKLGNHRLIALTKLQLASAYLLNNRTREAADHVEQLQKELPLMSVEDRTPMEPQVNLLRARISILSGNFPVAETELRSILTFMSKHPDLALNNTHFQSRVVLARVLRAQGRDQEGTEQLREAVKLVDAWQDQLPQNELQLSYDQDRRDVYDAAITAEYTSGGCVDSWNLAQGYKAKLFLNLIKGRLPSNRPELSEVRRRIPADVQVVEYATLGNQLLVWVISKDRFECRSAPITEDGLRRKIDLFVSGLTQKRSVDAAGRELFDVLIQPVSEFLSTARMTVFVPDRDLYRLPFSALQSRKNGRYLIETTPIFESPSVSYLFSDSAARSSGNTHVAFGSRTYDALTNAELNTLQDIDSVLPVNVGPAVTKEAFLGALSNHSLFYYAGHSAFDMRNALQSAILLDGGRPGPNEVSALEIMKQRIARNAAIFLSSCETSSGNSIDGPGIRGLTSAFLIGGAGSVVGSIWPVESASTMQLMPAMFKLLVHDGQPVARSLQAAQIRMIHDPAYAHPYYWSGFVITGNMSAAGLRVSSEFSTN